MPRNTGGNYSQPNGTFTTGTVIRSDVMNEKFGDIATALTDSLSRSGNGDMLSSLRLIDGSAAIPSLSFTNDPEIGLYLAGVNDVRMVSVASNLQKWTSTAITFYPATVFAPTASNTTAITATGTGTGTGITATGGGTTSAGASGGTFTGGVPTAGNVNGGSGITATGGAPSGTGTGGSGITATGGTSNGRGITATGTGNAPGINATGGSTSGAGVEGVGGSPTGVGVLGQGTGVGAGVQGTGGTTGNGVRGIGGSTSGMGVYGTGSPSGGEGVRAQAGVAATASVSKNALGVVNGYIGFDAVNPNSTVGFTNTITPANVVKAWAKVSKSGATVTVLDGFNITSAQESGGALQFTIADDMANATYAVTATATTNVMLYVSSQAAGTFSINGYTVATGGNTIASDYTAMVIVVGRQ